MGAAKTLIGQCIETAVMPINEQAYRERLREAHEAGYDQGYQEGVTEARAGTVHQAYSEEQVQEEIRKAKVNWEYTFKCRLKTIEGVFRLPEEWDQLIKLMEEPNNG